MVSKKYKEAIAKIINVERKPDTKECPIIENKTRNTTQLRVVIPKRYADIMGINKDSAKVVFQFKNDGTTKKPDYKLTAKIVKK